MPPHRHCSRALDRSSFFPQLPSTFLRHWSTVTMNLSSHRPLHLPPYFLLPPSTSSQVMTPTASSVTLPSQVQHHHPFPSVLLEHLHLCPNATNPGLIRLVKHLGHIPSILSATGHVLFNRASPWKLSCPRVLPPSPSVIATQPVSSVETISFPSHLYRGDPLLRGPPDLRLHPVHSLLISDSSWEATAHSSKQS